MKIDLHNHSRYSEDSSVSHEEAIERAIEAGLDGIAFTEHDSYKASEPVEALKEKYGGRIRLFRGAEYASGEGHVLVFGIGDGFFRAIGLHAPITEVIKAVNLARGAVVIPHPFREWSLLRADIGSLKYGIAAIEAFNGHNNRDENKLALKAAELHKLPTTGGSDSHARDEVGSCYTEFFEDVTYENFIDALRKGNYRGVPGRRE